MRLIVQAPCRRIIQMTQARIGSTDERLQLGPIVDVVGDLGEDVNAAVEIAYGCCRHTKTCHDGADGLRPSSHDWPALWRRVALLALGLIVASQRSPPS